MVAPSVLPGRAFQRVDRVSRLLFHWTAKDLSLIARTGQVPTFSRAAAAAAMDRLGVGRVAVHSQPRFNSVDLDGDLINESAELVLEGARTQLVADPENIGNWTATTCTRTAGQSDPFGGTGAYLLTPTGGAGSNVLQAVTFTADGTKAILGFMRAGTSTKSQIGVHENPGGYRHLVDVNWAAGVPTLATNLGAGTLFSVIPWGDGWYALAVNANSVVAANANRYIVFPDPTGANGTVFFFGANAWNAVFPSHYQGPSGGATVGVAEALSYPFAVEPDVDLTVMGRISRPRWAAVSGSLGSNREIISIGSSAGAPSGLALFGDATNRDLVSYINTPTTDASVATAIPAGAEIIIVSQFKNLKTGGQVAHDVAGVMSAFSSPATPFDAYQSPIIVLAKSTTELFTGLLELKVAAGLLTRSQILQLT